MSIVIAICLIAAELWMLYSGRHLIRQAIASYGWLGAEATVVDSEDASFTTAGINRWTGVGDVTYLETKHVYQYEVEGKIYQTCTYCFGGNVEQAAAAFLIGTNVPIFYDPKDPRNAVVKRGLQPSMFLGPLLIAAGIVMFVWWALSGGVLD